MTLHIMELTLSHHRQALRVRSDDPEEIAGFILERIEQRREDLGLFQALGAYRGDTLLGGFVYVNYREISDGWHTISMHMAGETGWLTRRTLRAFYHYPFMQLNCSRVAGSIRAGNSEACITAERMGCKLDGRIRSGISEDLDTCIYTMTRAECPWI
jgi:RimJ/RimL family protein N-acetyltransferase